MFQVTRNSEKGKERKRASERKKQNEVQHVGSIDLLLLFFFFIVFFKLEVNVLLNAENNEQIVAYSIEVSQMFKVTNDIITHYPYVDKRERKTCVHLTRAST